MTTSPSPLNPDTRRLLSRREVQIIVLVAMGLVDKQVARELGISVTTVRTHIERIGQKTGRTRRAQLTAMAYELDLMAEAEELGLTSDL